MQIIKDMPLDEYLALDRLSSSGIKLLLKNPALFHLRKTKPQPKDKAKGFGSSAHSFILENKLIYEEPLINKRTKEGKEEYRDFIKKVVPSDKIPEAFESMNMADASQILTYSQNIILNHKDYSVLMGMGQAFESHKIQIDDGLFPLKNLFKDGQTETTVLFEHESIPFKCRFDFFDEKKKIIMDYKTAATASPNSFPFFARKYGYDIQAALYLLTGLADTFLFVVQEKEAPYSITVWRASNDFIEEGMEKIIEGINIYKQCTEQNNWIAYPREILDLL